jgi:hypothetical protein
MGTWWRSNKTATECVQEEGEYFLRAAKKGATSSKIEPFSLYVAFKVCSNAHDISQFLLFQVDLKTFGNWEDSPEKMMMDMISDPNRVRREDR